LIEKLQKLPPPAVVESTKSTRQPISDRNSAIAKPKPQPRSQYGKSLNDAEDEDLQPIQL